MTPARSSPSMAGKPKRENREPRIQATERMSRRFKMRLVVIMAIYSPALFRNGW